MAKNRHETRVIFAGLNLPLVSNMEKVNNPRAYSGASLSRNVCGLTMFPTLKAQLMMVLDTILRV
jgi:hypothetical protein